VFDLIEYPVTLVYGLQAEEGLPLLTSQVTEDQIDIKQAC
jgi:hypothetical protein